MNVRPCFVCRKNTLIFLAAILLLLASSILPAAAATASGISLKAIIPENQVDKSQTYYDLRLAPGESQTIQLLVRNGGDEPVVANVDIYSASTGRNGLIQYNLPDIRDESLARPIEEVARVLTPQVTIPAKSEVTVDIVLELPDTAFDGCILGGVVVTAEGENADEEAAQQKPMQIANNYVYAVGLKITQTDTVIKPDLHLKNIKPGLVNYRPMVTVNLQNSEAVIIKGMQIDAQVYKKDSADIFKEMTMTNVDMAPNSSFDAGIDWNDKRLEAGVYRLKMRAEYEDQVWEWDEEFTIESTQANDINDESVYVEPGTPLWIYLLWGALLLLVIFFIIWFLCRRRNEEEKES